MKLPSFDPKLVPVVPHEYELPAVPAQALTAPALRRRFDQPPHWTPEIRAEPAFSSRPAMQAAVLMAIVQRPEPTVLLTRRTDAMSTHAGQVAFPGGKVDPTDSGPVAAALREADEETGLKASWISVIGSLPVYTTGTNFHVSPIVALVEPGFELKPNPQEVADVFEVPLAFLMDPSNHFRHRLTWDEQVRYWYSMPYHGPEKAADGERFIWGATAGMLRNLYHFLSA